MAGESHQDRAQERLAEYLELEHYIHELQTGRAPFPPEALTPSQAHIYRMALLFHAAAQGSEPRSAFVSALQTLLEQELQQRRTLPHRSDLPF